MRGFQMVALLPLVLMAAACGSSPTAPSVDLPEAPVVSETGQGPAPAAVTPKSTAAATATATPKPTHTAEPTAEPTATATSAPTREPLEIWLAEPWPCAIYAPLDASTVTYTSSLLVCVSGATPARDTEIRAVFEAPAGGVAPLTEGIGKAENGCHGLFFTWPGKPLQAYTSIHLEARNAGQQAETTTRCGISYSPLH